MTLFSDKEFPVLSDQNVVAFLKFVCDKSIKSGHPIAQALLYTTFFLEQLDKGFISFFSKIMSKR